MKLNKNILFLKIWTLHIYTFYFFFIFIYKLLTNDVYDYYIIFFGFLYGIIGWPILQIPLYFIVPTLLMLLLLKSKTLNSWFIAYVASVCFSYMGKFLFLLLYDRQSTFLLGKSGDINSLYILLPSIIISVIFNWLIFRKQYERLSNEM